MWWQGLSLAEARKYQILSTKFQTISKFKFTKFETPCVSGCQSGHFSCHYEPFAICHPEGTEGPKDLAQDKTPRLKNLAQGKLRVAILKNRRPEVRNQNDR